jgi:hypothetical protein
MIKKASTGIACSAGFKHTFDAERRNMLLSRLRNDTNCPLLKKIPMALKQFFIIPVRHRLFRGLADILT